MDAENDIKLELKMEIDEEVLVGGDPILESNEKAEQNYNVSLDEYKQAKRNKLLKKQDELQEMLTTAKCIMNACMNKSHKKQTNLPSIQQLQYYTNESIANLEEVVNNGVKTKSLKQVIADTKAVPASIIPFIYDDVREFFIQYYVRRKEIPSTVHLLQSLKEKRDETFYKTMNIATLVKNNLVKYHYLPKLNSYILTENPEFAYRRNLYLRQIIKHRTMKNIVYVIITKKQGKILSRVLAASATSGLITYSHKLIYRDVEDIYRNKEAKLFIQNDLIHKISTNSVVVLIQPHKVDNTPTPYSTTKTMLDWLNERYVPHDMNSHRSKLYNLIKLTKKQTEEPELYAEVLVSCGFKVLVCPIEYQNLNFFHNIEKSTIENKFTDSVDLMEKLSLYEWKRIEMKIIREEKRMMREDEEMEKIVENLFQMVKNGDLKEEDFPEGCRGTKEDNFAAHIGDIIVD